MRRSSVALGRRLALVALFGLVASSAWAQEFPTKAIRIIDGFAPGGTPDRLARIIASRMSQTFGQPVIVENKVGANGTIGMGFVAKADPDGYTLFVGSTSTMAVNPLLYKNSSFDPIKDFAPISMLAAQPLIVVVHPSVPAKTLNELVAYGKANPVALTVGIPGGIGHPFHLATLLFKSATGTPMLEINYAKGGAPALVDLLAGRTHLMFGMSYVSAHVRDGRLRALAVTGPGRMELLSDVPTVKEAGVPFDEVTLWNAMATRAGTPPAIIAKLNAEIVRILNLPEVRKQLVETGLEVIPSTPEEQARFILSEVERWGRVVKQAGIQMQ